MNKKNFFKISEAAHLTNVSRQTLIFYDKKDILKPAYVDDKQYRYYTIYQIHHIQIINMLKAFGLPLQTIKDYLNNKNKSELLDLLKDIQDKMYQKIRETNHYINIIDNKRDLIQRSLSIKDAEKIQFEERQPFEVFKSQPLSDHDQGENHFTHQMAFERQLSQLGLIGLKLDVICEKKYIHRNYNNHISYFCIRTNDKYPELESTTIQGGLYVTAYHKGRFQNATSTYMRLLDFIESNGLVVSGDAYETLISNHLTEQDDADYLFEIAIKVDHKNLKRASS